MAIVDGKIRCFGCKESFELNNFSPCVVSRGSGECKPCVATRRRKKYLANPGYYLGKNREWARKNPDHDKRAALKRYGLSLEGFKEMLKKQNGKCAICDASKNSDGKSLYVDHCHETGKIRGLLCRKCNTGIGLLGDNMNGILKAKDYLEGAKNG